jgi:hypothetical protein
MPNTAFTILDPLLRQIGLIFAAPIWVLTPSVVHRLDRDAREVELEAAGADRVQEPKLRLAPGGDE